MLEISLSPFQPSMSYCHGNPPGTTWTYLSDWNPASSHMHTLFAAQSSFACAGAASTPVAVRAAPSAAKPASARLVAFISFSLREVSSGASRLSAENAAPPPRCNPATQVRRTRARGAGQLAGVTQVTNDSDSPAIEPVTRQHPGDGQTRPVAWKPM